MLCIRTSPLQPDVSNQNRLGRRDVSERADAESERPMAAAFDGAYAIDI